MLPFSFPPTQASSLPHSPPPAPAYPLFQFDQAPPHPPLRRCKTPPFPCPEVPSRREFECLFEVKLYGIVKETQANLICSVFFRPGPYVRRSQCTLVSQLGCYKRLRTPPPPPPPRLKLVPPSIRVSLSERQSRRGSCGGISSFPVLSPRLLDLRLWKPRV